MDLIKMMMENRHLKGVNKKEDIITGASKPDSIGRPKKTAKIHSLSGEPSLKEQRAEIIRDKPRIPVVKNYFEQLIKHLNHSEDSD